jgi:acetyl/propionyl-CoA carboxylase alpha subunit/acetyl-CoA carboxylase carboxyltransferase component
LPFRALLIANRGEIAVRIARAAAGLKLPSVAVYSEDDAASLHLKAADEAVKLPGKGARAYLDIEAIVGAAMAAGCDAVHPGYGFLAERADFARACEAAGLTFIGPGPDQLALFGDKIQARAAAAAAGAPILAGSRGPVSLDTARDFLRALPEGQAMIIKAVAGGGGRGTRIVTGEGELESAYARCCSEAEAAFGLADVYAEAFLPRARHIEAQIAGDLARHVAFLGERDCSLQRRFQKIIEMAPAPALSDALREAIATSAERIAAEARYANLGTFEFLVDVSDPNGARFYFIEANARLQVEHTVTEEVTGLDLVQAQIRLADGATLAELGLERRRAAPGGYAVQARVNLEQIGADGSVRPTGGLITAYEPPGGPGVRVDGFGYSGYRTSAAFDPLLAKVIGYAGSPSPAQAIARTERALGEFRIDGVAANISFLRAVLAHPDLETGRTHTRWIDEHAPELVAAAAEERPGWFGAPAPAAPSADQGYAGARVASRDPLALFEHDARVKRQQPAETAPAEPAFADTGPPGTAGQRSPIQGTIVAIEVEVGDAVRIGQPLAIIEAMKMEHVIAADRSGHVRAITMRAGDVVRDGFPIVFVEEGEVEGGAVDLGAELDPDLIRPDLQESIDRHALTLDENRPDATARRHGLGYRMPRENIAELVDPGSFKEYWPLIVARQHRRFDMETLRRNTPADGLLGGIGTINADLVGEARARAMVVHYDYTVLAGTQGGRNHYKQDRLFDLALRYRLPLVIFAEGGGGRPGDDAGGPGVAVDTPTFTQFSRLSGLVPLVSIVNGRTFAGNTVLAACSDVIIATERTTLGMGGPAMIEGGGLGVYTPEEVGPMSVQVPNGVVDILVRDEAEAVTAARRYLSYFQGPVTSWEAHDQRRLRRVVPENRLRLYDMREIVRTLADKDSVLDIRPSFGEGVITALIRVEGQPLGVIANNPHHLAGAIDSNGADKGARFLQLCDAFDLPVLSLMDCPGMMVGPEVERTALVRHCARMFNTGANLSTPLLGVIVRKAYGLGVQAMCGASTLVGFFCVAWPTAEFAGMNIEGSVKLGYRKELAAIADPEERRREFDTRVASTLWSAAASTM